MTGELNKFIPIINNKYCNVSFKKKVLVVHCGECNNVKILLFVSRCHHNNRGATQQWTHEETTPSGPRTSGSVVEHRAVMREVMSSTPAVPTLRVLK